MWPFSHASKINKNKPSKELIFKLGKRDKIRKRINFKMRETEKVQSKNLKATRRKLQRRREWGEIKSRRVYKRENKGGKNRRKKRKTRVC